MAKTKSRTPQAARLAIAHEGGVLAAYRRALQHFDRMAERVGGFDRRIDERLEETRALLVDDINRTSARIDVLKEDI